MISSSSSSSVAVAVKSNITINLISMNDKRTNIHSSFSHQSIGDHICCIADVNDIIIVIITSHLDAIPIISKQASSKQILLPFFSANPIVPPNLYKEFAM
ncbi:hypothetical protein WUBG_05083 [Wuchereria bancrofti]|uniref:Uncharacterized protein n=1 Tax=Wuchereria bancrofti TaxID=6293 RepID=J9BA76_WUCBA|nr:hypothetical protein WUBG_05083 [Wuchereria bancrofti]